MADLRACLLGATVAACDHNAEVCGFAVLSNHFHAVLRVRPDLAQEWSDDEVAMRWRLLFPPRDEATGRRVEPAEHDLKMIRSDPRRVVELRRLARLSLGLNGECWLETVSNFGRWSKRAAGGRISLASAELRSGRRWFQGQRAAKTAFV